LEQIEPVHDGGIVMTGRRRPARDRDGRGDR